VGSTPTLTGWRVQGTASRKCVWPIRCTLPYTVKKALSQWAFVRQYMTTLDGPAPATDYHPRNVPDMEQSRGIRSCLHARPWNLSVYGGTRSMLVGQAKKTRHCHAGSRIQSTWKDQPSILTIRPSTLASMFGMRLSASIMNSAMVIPVFFRSRSCLNSG